MAEHSTILNIDTHEPKHITDAVTSDAGKVITPSSTVNGSSSIRKLKLPELDISPGTSLQGVRINAAGTALEYITPGGSVYGQLDVSANTLATTITASATPVLITGATLTTPGTLATAGLSSGVTFVNTSNNELLKIFTAGIYSVFVALSFEGVTGATFAFHIAKNGAPISTARVRRKTSNSDVGTIAIIENISLVANDTIQVSIQNEGGTGNPTITDLAINTILLDAT